MDEQITQNGGGEKAGGGGTGGVRGFFRDLFCGVLIGVAFIIPGFSGGSVAAILGIYEKLVGAIADIFRDFKRSFLTLLPIGIGLILGAAALLFPLGWALNAYPIPTVCLFVGLALGGLPSITEKMGGFKPVLLVPLLLALVSAACLSFLPTAGDVDLFSLDAWGYVLLFIIGAVGSCALVIPGISGSMLLLIFGYYNPIVTMITDYFFRLKEFWTCVGVLGCVGAGIVVGFFLISVVMKFLLRRYPRGTYYAIFGFIVGSIPTVYISTAKDVGLTFETLPLAAGYWVAAVALLLAGFAVSYLFVRTARRKTREPEAIVLPERGGEEM